MSLFSNVNTDESIEQEKDMLGGGGIPDSGLYEAQVKVAYGMKSDSGAQGLVLHLDLANGQTHRETLWVTSGDKKGNKNFYMQGQTKRYLPGFLNAEALCLLAAGKALADLTAENKVVNLYDFDQKKEVPTEVPMVMDLVGKPIYVGLIKQTVNKNVKGDDGQYHPTAETRDEVVIDKFFRHSDKKTTSEVRAQSEAAFFDRWAEKNTGIVKDRTKKVEGGQQSSALGGNTNTAAAKPQTSLFATG